MQLIVLAWALSAAFLRVSYAARVAARVRGVSRSGHPSVCDHGIVAETCRNLNYGTTDFFGSGMDRNSSVVHAAELAEHLMVSHYSVREFFDAIGVRNQEHAAMALSLGAFAVECQELCEKTLASIPEIHRPPSSDVACYMLKGMIQPSCDLDVSAEMFQDMGLGHTDLPRYEEVVNSGSHAHEAVLSEEVAHQHLAALSSRNYPLKSVEELRISIANAFRVYPLIGITVDEATNEATDAAEILLEMKVSSHNVGAASDQAMNSNALSYGTLSRCTGAKKARCISNPACEWKWTGNWKTSCVESDSSAPVERVEEASDSVESDSSASVEKVELEQASDSNDCVDKAVTGVKNIMEGGYHSCAELLEMDMCDTEEIQDACSKTCGLTCHTPKVRSGTWQADVLKVGIKAQAYVSKALQKMGAHEVPHLVKTYFGSNSQSNRAEIRRVLNELSSMLTRVDYVYPGPECDADTWAYVHKNPPHNTNRRGQYVVYLCKRYMKSSLRVQIEALLHEGTHHEPMSTADICLSGKGKNCEFAYGRTRCKILATESPNKALQNADTFCFFISDVVN